MSTGTAESSLGFGGAVELHKHLLLSSQTHSLEKDRDISPCSVSLPGFGVTARVWCHSQGLVSLPGSGVIARAAEEPQALCRKAVTPQREVLSSLHLSGPWMVQKP